MSVIVINSDSPSFVCSSPACYIDAESIDTSYVYDSGYASSCDTVGAIPYSIGGGSVGPAGPAGTDGRSIVSVIWTSNSGGGSQGDPGTTDTYTITYNIAPLTTTFTVYNGIDGIDGADGADGAQGIQGIQGIQGTAGTNGYTILTGLIDPVLGEGVNGDLFLNSNSYQLFKKVAGTWENLITSLKGADGAAGAAGTNGTDGDQWTYGSGEPVDVTEELFDSYYIDTDTNDVWYKEAGTTTWGASAITNLNGDSYYTTSTTEVTLSTESIGSTIVLTVPNTLSYSVGQYVVAANSTDDYFVGKVSDYTDTDLSIEVTYIKDTDGGMLDLWEVNIAGVTESDSNPKYYYIYLPYESTLHNRCISVNAVYPSGWTVDSGNNVVGNPLSSGENDLVIKHNLGKAVVDVIVKAVFTAEGKQQKLNGSEAYGTLEDDSTYTYVGLLSFSNTEKALEIYISFE